jgi:hypothetical protein
MGCAVAAKPRRWTNPCLPARLRSRSARASSGSAREVRRRTEASLLTRAKSVPPKRRRSQRQVRRRREGGYSLVSPKRRSLGAQNLLPRSRSIRAVAAHFPTSQSNIPR